MFFNEPFKCPQELVLNVRHDSELTSSLNSYGKLSLVLSAVTGDAAGKDLSSLGNELLKLCSIFIIDNVVFTTENANLLTSTDAAFSLSGAIGTLGLIECHNTNLLKI
jgi:hypothetical protein